MMTYEQAQKEVALREEWNGLRAKMETAGLSAAARDAFHQRTLDITEELDSLRAVPTPTVEIEHIDMDTFAASQEMAAIRANPAYFDDGEEGAKLHARMTALHACIDRQAPMPEITIVTSEEHGLAVGVQVAARAAGLPIATRVEMAKE